MDSAGTSVRFEIVRDAGTLTCEGYFKGGHGSGAFTFSANPRLVSEMQSLGYGALSAEETFSMAMHDVTLAYERDVRALGVPQVSTDDLIAMRIHGVTPEYIRGLQAHGLKNLTIDQIVSLKIHGIE